MTDFAIIRTDHSLHEGSGKSKDYVGFAAANGIKTLVIADRTMLSDGIGFYKKCLEYSINPVMGALLSVYDPKRVYAAQSSRNGGFFSLLYQYLTALIGEEASEEYVSKCFTDIEGGIVAPLRKRAISAPKATSTQQKESLLFAINAASILGLSCIEQRAELQSKQLGYSGAASKKKLSNESRKTFFGESVLDEEKVSGYLKAFPVLYSEIKAGSQPSFTASHKWCGFIDQYVIPSYKLWAKGIEAKKGDKLNKQDIAFSTYLESIAKVHAKFKFSFDDNHARSVISDFLGLAKAGTSVIPEVMGDLLGEQPHMSILQLKLNPKDTEVTCHEVLFDEIYRHLQESASSDQGAPFSLIDSEGSNVALAQDNLDLTSLYAEAFLMYWIKETAGSFKPFPISDEITDLEKREIQLHALYPVLLEAAANYKDKNESCYSDITLFANTQAGFLNIKRLISLSYMEGQSSDLIETKGDKRKVNSYPKLPIERLREFSDGLVAIVGLQNDEVDKAFRYKTDMGSAFKYYEEIFGSKNVLVGIQRSTTQEDGEYLVSLEAARNSALVDYASSRGLVAFAMNNAFFLRKDDYEVMDNKAAMLLDEYVNSPSRIKNYFHGNYLKSPEELSEIFSDTPTLLNNTSKLAEYIGIGNHLDIALDAPVLPNFPIPDGFDETTYMKHLAEEGMWKKFNFNTLRDYKVASFDELDEEQAKEVESLKEVFRKRLDYEVEVIGSMGFSGYFLIVADFIVWGKSNGVPIGPGRGSGAGSIVAYGLNITDIDPIKYGLLFERFLNPERVSMPDFDVDFGSGFHPETGEPVNRDSVIAYVQNKYNNPDSLFPSVGQIATHGLIAAKSGIKKLAKTRFLLPSFSDQLTKLFPDAPEVKISDCLAIPEVMFRKEREREVHELMELTSRMEGLKQNSGVHAGGVVIAPTEMVDFTPFHIDTRDTSKIIAQFDKNDVETAGLVKFDFLGLANLTTIEYARKYIRLFKGVDIDMSKIDYGDKDTFDLLRTGNSHGVFQVESDGMRKLLRKISCDNMEDLSALLALYRPGPLQSGMVDNFIDRKHGREIISYPDAVYQHDCLKPILEPTYGIILYQEQVMQCAQAMSGYTLGGADLLRRAMGKKKPEEMAKQREVFQEGAVSQRIDSELSMKIFDLIEKFAGYGFNKSHSMAYAHVTFQTAYLKTHFTREYMAALLTDQSSTPDKLKATLVDCNRNGIIILPPDVNRSDTEFLPEGENAIRYGLLAIKGVGEDKLKAILEERERNGEFKSVEDLRKRCGGKFDKKVAEGLLFAGALDSLETARELPDDALRKENELATSEKTTPKLEVLKSDFFAKKHERDSLVRQGSDLREMISSVISYYGERYGLTVSSHIDMDNKALGETAAYLIKEIPLMVEKGADKFSVSEDVKNLETQLRRRNELANNFRKVNSELEAIESQLNAEKDRLSSGGEAQTSDEGERLVSFDKRAYLWADIEAIVMNLTVANLAKAESFEKALSSIDYKVIERFSDAYRLKQEMGYLAYYVSGHPFDIDNLRVRLSHSFGNTPISQLSYPSTEGLEEAERREVERSTAPSRVAGVIASIRQIKIKKETSKNFGRDMAFIVLDDSFGEMTVMVLPDMFDLIKSNLFIGAPMAIEGVVLRDNYADDDSMTVTPWVVYDPQNPENEVYENRPKGRYNKNGKGR
ncbi:DNA polymerase III subunit alpha [Vibrio vulnificus]|nr:DNA polymerase III subunit alpha [Vibrio vulnificus]